MKEISGGNSAEERPLRGTARGRALLALMGIGHPSPALASASGLHGPESWFRLAKFPAAVLAMEPGSLALRVTQTLLWVAIGALIGAFVWVFLLRRAASKQAATIDSQHEYASRLESKYRRLFESNLAAVFTWRPDGRIVDCNLTFAHLLGFTSREEAIGRSYWDFEIDPGQRERGKAGLGDETATQRDATLRRDDHSTVHLQRSILRVETPEGTLYESTAIDVTQLRQHQAELQLARETAVYESLNDPLTGLPNRRLLLSTLALRLAESRREGNRIALLFIDLDGFKPVNDSLGHRIGDALLVEVATRLRTSVRQQDTLSRLGSDEFMVILEKIPQREDAVRVAESLLAAISTPFVVEGQMLSISATVGVSLYPEDAVDAEELMQRADTAMYSAKRDGKNRVGVYAEEMGQIAQERLKLENLLRGAIGREEISVHYQPEFDLADHRLIRFEALARWTHPILGPIPPLKFIPIAEESGLIGPLGAYIMEQACFEAVRWQNTMPHPVQVAVNVSGIQFRQKGFVEEVAAILERTGLEPGLLQIELTESVMMSGSAQSAEIMNQLRDLGISLAIDDFGTGYSNLSYLPSLPFDFLKIDASFLRNMDAHSESEPMIRTLISLAHNFGMRVIVEGVERQEQLDLMKSFGANEVQGYLMGRPTALPMEILLLPAEK